MKDTKIHLANYIITMVSMITEGLSNIVLTIPGLFASVSFIIFSPLYKYVGELNAIKIGITGLKAVPIKIALGILLILLSPVGYFINLYKMGKQKPAKKKKKSKKYKGAPNII